MRTMSDYTPTTEQVRNQFAYTGRKAEQERLQVGFDRWLATVKAQALTDAADQMRDRFTAAWLRGLAREYTQGHHKIVGAFATPETNKENQS